MSDGSDSITVPPGALGESVLIMNCQAVIAFGGTIGIQCELDAHGPDILHQFTIRWGGEQG